MLLGTGMTALYEATAAFCGYWAAGVPRPLVWAALTGIASVVPVVGMMMIAGPVCGWLVFSGRASAGLALGLWCIIGVGGVANYVLRPWLLGSKMRMNDLLAFIALFGGVAAFGLLGMILGPIVAALLVSLVHIYQRDYRPRGRRVAP
jgi:predicted PurR-regulated permease PerM